MKAIDYIIIRSTLTPEGKPFTKDDLIKHQTGLKAHGGLGLNRPLTDTLIGLEGELTTIIEDEHISSADQLGISEGSQPIIGTAKIIDYVGGLTPKTGKAKDTRTEAQKATIEAILKFYIRRFPKVRIFGMNQIPGQEKAKSPGYDVAKDCKAIGIPEENLLSF